MSRPPDGGVIDRPVLVIASPLDGGVIANPVLAELLLAQAQFGFTSN